MSDIQVDSKALVKYSDMDKQQKQTAIDCAGAALERFEEPRDVAKYVKGEFDKRFGGVWHCIVGKSFGCYVSHKPHSFIYYQLGDKAILLFQAKK